MKSYLIQISLGKKQNYLGMIFKDLFELTPIDHDQLRRAYSGPFGWEVEKWEGRKDFNFCHFWLVGSGKVERWKK